MGFVVNKVTLELVSLGELQFSLVIIIPPMHNIPLSVTSAFLL
jgi:hypothetical protein